MRRWIGTALLLSWTAVVGGCGDARIADKPNFAPKDLPTIEGGDSKPASTTARLKDKPG
jgi:hypothetical protein